MDWARKGRRWDSPAPRPWEPRRKTDSGSAAEHRAAYEEIIRRCQGDLLRVSRTLCRGQEDPAQDLVQEALVRGYEAFLNGRFQDGSNARAWLLRILTNLFINDYRRRTRWEGPAPPDGAEIGCEERPESRLLDQALDERLEKALAALTPDLRACVILVDVDGMEYHEAADALGIPVGTVRSRLSRARFQLHSKLYHYAQSRRWL
jgi:RNA polymerase sigma-70 factor, ECF subfamily